MKKFLFSMLCIAFFFSCKKEEAPVSVYEYDPYAGQYCPEVLKVHGQVLNAQTGMPLSFAVLNETAWYYSLARDTTDLNGYFILGMAYRPCGRYPVSRPSSMHVKLMNDTTMVLDSIVYFNSSIVNDSVWVNLYAYPN
jgi:hypothetical protein